MVRMICYKLPENLRGIISRAHEYFEMYLVPGTPEYVVRKVSEFLRSFKVARLWCVGDIVCSNFLRLKLRPHSCIIDGKTLRREKIDVLSLSRNFSRIIRIRNPPGFVCDEAFKAVRQALSKPTLIIVEGEEDLTGFAVVLAAPIGDALVFGVPPNVGVAFTYIDREIKFKAAKILRKFEVVAIK